MTPILKTYNSNLGFNMCVQAMQVYGGAGYTKDYPIEQLARDCKIASIYEGTDGIQAMDLLARKMPMKEGQVFMGLIKEIQTITEKAKNIKGLESYGEKLDEALKVIQEHAKTGEIGDGKIFIYNLQDVVRIRTGERGKEAI